MKTLALIFDMDGTMLDNYQYHLEAWKKFFKKHGIKLSEEEYKKKYAGLDSASTIRATMGDHLTEEQVRKYRDEKEQMYRDLIAPHIHPVNGLIPLLQSIRSAGIPMGVATSTTKDNIEFTMDKLHLKPYFSIIVDVTMISKGKPDPQIYLTTAGKLKVQPENCIVFEDSLNGIKSADNAHMKVIALTTSHSPDELHMADKVINDFTEIDVQQIRQIASRT